MDKLFTVLQKKSKGLQEVISSNHIQDILIKKWSHIFGKLAQHLSFFQYRKGVLTIRSDNPMWVSEIDFYKTDLLEKINSHIPKRPIYNLKIVFYNNKKEIIVKNKLSKNKDQSLEALIRFKNTNRLAEGKQLCTKCGKMYTKESLCVYCKLNPVLV
jgi:hypothetical protein